MSILKLMKGRLKGPLSYFRGKRRRRNTDTVKPTPDDGPRTEPCLPSSPIEEYFVVQIPENVIATARHFEQVASKTQLSNLLLWMLANEEIRVETNPDGDSTKLLDANELSTWFEVSVCIESGEAQPKGLKRTAKELGLSWEDDVSWRLGRLILFFGSKYSAQCVTRPSRGHSHDDPAGILLKDLHDLLAFAEALQPGDGEETRWSALKVSVIRTIESYMSCRSLDALLTLPDSVKILLSPKDTWYCSLEGVRHESKIRSGNFLASLASHDLTRESSTTASETGRSISSNIPTGSSDPMSDPENPETEVSTEEVHRALSWEGSAETRVSTQCENQHQRWPSCTVSELNARVEALERKSSASWQAQQHSRQQGEIGQSSLSAEIPGGYNHVQESVPVGHTVRQGVQQSQSMAALLPTESIMAAQSAPPQIDRGREDWIGWGQRRDARSQIPRPVKSSPFFSHYGQADAHLPRVTDSPSVDPAHGGPFIVPTGAPLATAPSMLSMPAMPLINRCNDGVSGKSELAADFTTRDRDMRPINRLQVRNDELEDRRVQRIMQQRGIDISQFQDFYDEYAPHDRPPTRQHVPNPKNLRRSATNRSGRYEMYDEYPADHYEQDYPPMRQHAPNPRMPRRSATTRGNRHDQDRDYGIFDRRDPYKNEPGYTARPRPNRRVEIDYTRRRRPSADPWDLSPLDGPRLVRVDALHKHISPAFGVHLQKPSKVTRLKRSMTSA